MATINKSIQLEYFIFTKIYSIATGSNSCKFLTNCFKGCKKLVWHLCKQTASPLFNSLDSLFGPGGMHFRVHSLIVLEREKKKKDVENTV